LAKERMGKEQIEKGTADHGLRDENPLYSQSGVVFGTRLSKQPVS
jgi:hypothetical protein